MGFDSSKAVFLNCMNSPSTRFAITVAKSSITSASLSLANATEALPRRKSPARTAILFPNDTFAEGEDLRAIELSITSSWSKEAVCMSSVISASRLCEGSISEPSELYVGSIEAAESGLSDGEDGLTSERTVGGDIGLSIVDAAGVEGCRRTVLSVEAVARDIRRTSKGRTCFPSELV